MSNTEAPAQKEPENYETINGRIIDMNPQFVDEKLDKLSRVILKAVELTEKASDYAFSKYDMLVDLAAKKLNEKDRGVASKYTQSGLLALTAVGALASGNSDVSAMMAAGSYALGVKATVDKSRQNPSDGSDDGRLMVYKDSKVQYHANKALEDKLISKDGVNIDVARESAFKYQKDESASPYPVGDYLHKLAAQRDDLLDSLIVRHSALREQLKEESSYPTFLERLGAKINNQIEKASLFISQEKHDVYADADGNKSHDSIENLVKSDILSRQSLWDRVVNPTPGADLDFQVAQIIQLADDENKDYENMNGRPIMR